ncbi:MAG: HAD hydrolase-like protein [Thermodesulfovibrio sp.]|nr:HAD hydrolase-like protein [Thermodesulfovibrio sp.]
MKLILFDIDGTLISTGGAGTRALDKAFFEVLDIKNAFINFEMAGKTDIQIIKEGLLRWQIKPSSPLIKTIIKSYLKNLEVEMNNNSKHIKPGVIDFLNFIQNDLGYPIGLLTGNLEKGARVKLAAFDLNHYFPFGAFGSDHEDRRYLLPIALTRFSRLFRRKISFNNCIVVGDTPRDVACAKPYGAKVIAVATGPYTVSELITTEADVVVEELSEIEKILKVFE